MIAISQSHWRWPLWRLLKSLLAILVSLLLLTGAAIEAGRRLLPRDPRVDGRLVEVGSLQRGPA